MRVTEAEGAEGDAVLQQRNDERGTRREFAVQLRTRTADFRGVVVDDALTQCRLVRSHDEGDGADQIITADRRPPDQHAHRAGQVRGAVRGSDTAQCARRRDVDEAEVGEVRNGFADASIEGAAVRCECAAPGGLQRRGILGHEEPPIFRTLCPSTAGRYECSESRYLLQAQRVYILRMSITPDTEAWQRGPVPGFSPLLMPVVHSLIQVKEDLERLVGIVPAEHLWQRPGGAASIAFHVSHTGGALDRLLTYARGESLTDAQRAAARAEGRPADPPATLGALVADVDAILERAFDQLRATNPDALLEERKVGRAGLPSNVLGLLFHAAEHCTRHVGQAITTAKILAG